MKTSMNLPTQRIFAAEGSVHLYSSQPSVLTPAELYQAKADPVVKQFLTNCNLYMIASRSRILIDPTEFSLDGNILHGSFLVQRQSGFERVPFEWHAIEGLPGEGDVIDAAIAVSGTHLCISFAARKTIVAAHIIVGQAKSNLTDQDCDLEVLYVGQGIGKSRKRSAIDRLLNHSTLQRILAEAVTYKPEAEVLLLLYRFEHRKTFISTGGDLDAEPHADMDEERAHMNRMGDVKLTRHAQIALAEAALIRYFQPYFNTQLKESNFATGKRIKVLEQLLKKDMTGLIVEICTANINSRLQTASAIPLAMSELFEPNALNGSRLDSDDEREKWAAELHFMAHSHFATFPLTTPDERDTFMHGTLWNGEKNRANFMGKSFPNG